MKNSITANHWGLSGNLDTKRLTLRISKIAYAKLSRHLAILINSEGAVASRYGQRSMSSTATPNMFPSTTAGVGISPNGKSKVCQLLSQMHLRNCISKYNLQHRSLELIKSNTPRCGYAKIQTKSHILRTIPNDNLSNIMLRNPEVNLFPEFKEHFVKQFYLVIMLNSVNNQIRHIWSEGNAHAVNKAQLYLIKLTVCGNLHDNGIIRPYGKQMMVG